MKKNRFFKKITLLLALSILATCLLIPAAASASAPGGVSSVVDGRILRPDKTGDTSDWIEVATYGKYSLIVRKQHLNWYTNGHYGDPAWQYIPYGTTNAYKDSGVRKIINNWFNGRAFANYPVDNLPLYARLRQFTVSNNAMGVLGTCNTDAAMFNGLSLPMPYVNGFGEDVAFALSYSEAANYISWNHFMRNKSVATQPSNFVARSNYTKILLPLYNAGKMYGMWLRSPGDSSFQTAGVLSSGVMQTHDSWGRVFQAHISDHTAGEYGLVYPALWVDGDIFETKYNITVNYYRDGISPSNLVGSDTLPPQVAGSYIDVNLAKYAPPGYKTPGTRSGDEYVAARQNTVNVVYSRNVNVVHVYYYADSTAGRYLGYERIETDMPIGAPVQSVVDRTKYAPPGYKPYGIIEGDTLIRESTFVYVVYEKELPTEYIIYVNHYLQRDRGSAIYDLYSQDSYTESAGAYIDCYNYCLSLQPTYLGGVPTPEWLIVDGDQIVNIYYNVNPYW